MITLEIIGRLWEVAAIVVIVVGFYATVKEWRDGS